MNPLLSQYPSSIDLLHQVGHGMDQDSGVMNPVMAVSQMDLGQAAAVPDLGIYAWDCCTISLLPSRHPAWNEWSAESRSNSYVYPHLCADIHSAVPATPAPAATAPAPPDAAADADQPRGPAFNCLQWSFWNRPSSPDVARTCMCFLWVLYHLATRCHSWSYGEQWWQGVEKCRSACMSSPAPLDPVDLPCVCHSRRWCHELYHLSKSRLLGSEIIRYPPAAQRI